MATKHLGIELPNMTAILRPFLAQTEGWPESKRERFHREWMGLVAAGAEWVEIETGKDSLRVRLSDDLMAHFQAWGIV